MQSTTLTEYSTLTRHELDIEHLLRTTLEFIASRTGPTNIATYLPTTSGDWSLGAYMIYDMPKETADIALDLAADKVETYFMGKGITKVFAPVQEKALALLGDVELGCFPATHNGELLAVTLVFRDQFSPYGSMVRDQLVDIMPAFAAQLAKTIRIHHRHIPPEKWGKIGDPPQSGPEPML